VHERREAGAEIVQRKAHAELAQRMHGALYLLAAAHHRGFGEFEFQPVRVDAALVDQPVERR